MRSLLELEQSPLSRTNTNIRKKNLINQLLHMEQFLLKCQKVIGLALLPYTIGLISAALSCLVYPPLLSGTERGLLSRTAAGNRAYLHDWLKKTHATFSSNQK